MHRGRHASWAGRTTMVGALVLAMAAVGACTAPTGGGAATATPAAASVVVEVRQDATLGSHLVVGGRSVYLFTNDPMGGGTTCTGDCATAWPPVLVPDGSEASGGAGMTGGFSVVERPDGGRQVAYEGHPLYFFAGDTATDATAGQGVNGVWFLVTPEGTAVGASAGEPSPTPAAESAGPTCSFYCY